MWKLEEASFSPSNKQNPVQSEKHFVVYHLLLHFDHSPASRRKSPIITLVFQIQNLQTSEIKKGASPCRQQWPCNHHKRLMLVTRKQHWCLHLLICNVTYNHAPFGWKEQVAHETADNKVCRHCGLCRSWFLGRGAAAMFSKIVL